jgi:hypothetical protein
VLDLSSNPLRDSALQDLSCLVKLRELAVDDTEMTGRGLTALQGLSALTRLSMDSWQRLACPLMPLASLTQLRSLSITSDAGSARRR